MKKILALLMSAIMMLSMVACGNKTQEVSVNVDDMKWEEILE